LSAERVGFEPTIQFPVYNLSRVARSTTLTPLRIKERKDKKIMIARLIRKREVKINLIRLDLDLDIHYTIPQTFYFIMICLDLIVLIRYQLNKVGRQVFIFFN